MIHVSNYIPTMLYVQYSSVIFNISYKYYYYFIFLCMLTLLKL